MGSPAPKSDLGQFTAESPAEVSVTVNIESPVKDDVAPEGDAGTSIAGDVEKSAEATTPATDAKEPEAA